MSAVNNNLLAKAVSSMHVGAVDPGPILGLAPSALKASSPLVFPSPNFKLNEKEDAFLRSLIYRYRLLPNLSLLDLLFYDLHCELSKLRHCMRPEDSKNQLIALEDCYAHLVQDPTKTEALTGFLKTVILNAIVSNNQLRQPASGTVQQVKAVGDTKLITETLCERVQFFQKFAEVFARQPQFIHHRLSTLVGNERFLAHNQSDLIFIFRLNSEFLDVALQALSRTNDRVHAMYEHLSSGIKKIKLISNLKLDGEALIGINVELLTLCMFIEKDASPFIIRLFCESFTACTEILLDSLKNLQAMQTAELDRAFLIGKIPYTREGSRERLDPRDMLSEFRAQHFIEPSFRLTDPESDLIQELFKTTHLDSKLTLFDILGFALSERLQALKKITPQFNEIIARSQGILSAYCLRFYIGLQRSSSPYVAALGSVNAYTRRFALLPGNFLEWIDAEFTNLQNGIKNTRIEARQQARVLEQMTQTVIPLRNLYGKLLQSKGHYHLFLRAVGSYQGFKELDRRNEAGRAFVTRYFRYVKSGYETGIQKQLFGMGYNFDAVMKKELPFSDPPRETEMVAFGTKIVDQLHQMHQLNKRALRELQEAIHQRLDHKTWLARTGQKSAVEKTPEEFKEQLFSNLALTEMILAFLSDTLRLVEHRVYPRGTLTTESCAFRLAHNMLQHLHKKGSHIPASSLQLTTSSKFNAILVRMNDLFTSHPEINDFSLDNQHLLAGSFIHTEWLELLLPIEPTVTALLNRSLSDLRALKEELIQELKTQWSALSLEELQRLDVSAMKEAIFQEGLRLMRPLWILSDMLVLLQKRRYSEEAAIIPQELADVMDLDGLPEMLQKLIQDKTPAPPKEIAVEVVEEKPAPAPKPEETAVDQPKKAIRVKKQQQEKKPAPQITSTVPAAVMAPAPLPEVQELAYLTKSREILRRLSDMGFYEVRTKGSHHILNGPHGGQVVVPDNNNLPRGTRNGIVNQATSALTNS